ncbi:carbohydrate ABC transporter permease [Paenibacillus thiaminolyticus]|uniref:Carbohydrate ABC transporter permease n=1 Tax=Paenibacillus thiaminolyticus TaxID=49283 RepID=A0A3A3GPJ7_PANTH|nr:carbohydrate ABC transporter permease [Paenibacillus thiaminolyticus]RJG24924.1 carbohydrate ABC transporter permease [Paenibacillus thiaminolyticus]
MRKKTRDFHNLSRGTNLIFNLIAGLFAFLCVYPFLFVIVISLTEEGALARNGYSIFPEKWSFSAYKYIFEAGDQLLRSYGVTIMITLIGTVISLAVICLYAYAISRRNFEYRNFFSFIAFFTMLFNGGLVPTYMVLTQILHLKDTIWALILPLIMNAFYVLIMRTFYKTTVPDAIIESAKIDGAGELRAFITIVLPISLPGIATIGLFATLGFWNDWFNALLYIDNPALVPLQSMLMRIENSMQFLLNNAQLNASGQTLELMRTLPQESTRMALVVLATLPIACAYPFFQRYFVQGLTIGAVKE